MEKFGKNSGKISGVNEGTSDVNEETPTGHGPATPGDCTFNLRDPPALTHNEQHD
jgi:hypothetical protein